MNMDVYKKSIIKASFLLVFQTVYLMDFLSLALGIGKQESCSMRSIGL